MKNDLTETGKSDSAEHVEAESVAVRPDTSAETTSDGRGYAGPRVERAEARQQNRDAATATNLPASNITDYVGFVNFLCDAGFTRAFAKRVTNRDAFNSAADPSPDDSQIAEAITASLANFGDYLKE